MQEAPEHSAVALAKFVTKLGSLDS